MTKIFTAYIRVPAVTTEDATPDLFLPDEAPPGGIPTPEYFRFYTKTRGGNE